MICQDIFSQYCHESLCFLTNVLVLGVLSVCPVLYMFAYDKFVVTREVTKKERLCLIASS